MIRGEELHTVHLSEIHTLLIDSTMVTITGYLLCELLKEKIKVIVCDENRNPAGEVLPYYNSHDTSSRVQEQACWDTDHMAQTWRLIVQCKIMNQASLLQNVDINAAQMLRDYARAVTSGDGTNREGHAAKVYFNRIFGKGFNRNAPCDENTALNYGYTILLSCFNKEIAAHGYVTQLGIHHRNSFNCFNLSSDLMEPFRCLVDAIVLRDRGKAFDHEYKMRLVNLLNQEVHYDRQTTTVSNAITRYVCNITDYLGERGSWNDGMGFQYEDTSHASSGDV